MKRTGLLFIAAALALFGSRPPFTPEDVWEWRSASDPRIASEGAWVVYVESWNDRAADRSFANLWTVSANGKTRRRLTEGNWRDRSPRWSPDNARIAWLSERTGKPQIWTRRFEFGTEAPVTTATPEGTGPPLSLAWSVDGQSIAFTALVTSKAAAPAWAPPAILPRLRRTREGYVQIFVVPASGGTARQVSSGDFDYSGEPAWMPDGRSILSSRDDGQLYAIRVADRSAKPLTEEGRNENPVVASDSGKIAWLRTDEKPGSRGVRKVCAMNPDGSRLKVLSGSLDRDAANPQWSNDSRTVYFVAEDHGSTHVYAAHNDGAVRQVTSAPERLWDFSLADNGRAVAVRSTSSEAGNVFTFTVDRVTQPATLAGPNEHLLAEREIGAMEEFAVSSAGNTIQAWLVKPPGFDAGRRYPLLLDIRDDPRAMYGVDFNLRTQILAAGGFVVLCVNPRGAPGYGELFGNLLRTRNPGDDYDDLMRAVDFAVSKGYIDSNHLAIAGAVLAAWSIGHTGRFAAAVVRNPVSVWAKDPWVEPEQFVKHSPIFFAKDFRTPTLVFSGDRDPEGEALYAALEAKKVDAALVRFAAPDKPGEQVLELVTVLRWLRR